MILDNDGVQCQTVNIDIGASTATTRSWDIYVTQYTCGQADEAGPPGCLQYFTGPGTHVIKKYVFFLVVFIISLLFIGLSFCSFGYLTSNTAAASQDAATTHLSSQRYDICFRR